MMLVGLDMQRRYITACALTPDGGLVAEAKRVPAALDNGILRCRLTRSCS